MTIRITGERLDQQGYPIEGTGFPYDSEGELAKLLPQRNSPIVSHPKTGEWLFGLVDGEASQGEFARGVIIFRPGNLGPPEHIHPTYAEHFKILSGEFLFLYDGEERRLRPGEELTIPQGVRHTFRCVSDEYGVLIGETWPASNVDKVISTLFGLAHEGKVGKQGQPKFLQAMMMGEALADDTLFLSPPPAVVLLLTKLFAPIGRLFGYQAIYPQYREFSFWETRVNQPTHLEREKRGSFA